MSPTTIIKLGMLTSVVLILSLSVLLFPKKRRKMIWIVLGLLLIGGMTFYNTRSFILQHQTNEFVQQLNKYLTQKYPNEKWGIEDKNMVEISPVGYLHVIFESEPGVAYEYRIKDTSIKQVHILIADSKIMPQHDEGGVKKVIEQ
ncbi:DUF3139 domain-containing protein [Pseudobacillus wudalianchiensis]|uniref:DUF3139 domain-containing protein n=1 Tax=Pseudobacillus wudalianchiensis TaxID=1743143 RepID=A0A1B9B931_9BACI|nr:DUF3139 domain-containing protein [Bacillus wudalianchiensis]OCA92590.1 hypothetical protein A8F95_02525 [Bacillus wudalianchiensis]